MKPEYQFKVEGLISKEQVMNGLLASGYILSCKKRLGDIYDITVYGKERLDGNGGKVTDWMEKHGNLPNIGGNGIIDIPKVTSAPPNITTTPWAVSTTNITDAISTISNSKPYAPKKDETFWADTAKYCDTGFFVDGNYISKSEVQTWTDHLNNVRK